MYYRREGNKKKWYSRFDSHTTNQCVYAIAMNSTVAAATKVRTITKKKRNTHTINIRKNLSNSRHTNVSDTYIFRVIKEKCVENGAKRHGS